MTVIVVAKTGKSATMAADRQTTCGPSQFENLEPKLWVDGKYLIGCAGDVRAIQVLRYRMDWPTYRPKEDRDWLRFVVTRVVPAMRSAMEGQVLGLDEDYLGDIQVIMATRGRFAAVYGNGAVMSDRTGRFAIGSGAQEALGFMGSSGPWDAAQVVSAVRRSAATNIGVSGPVSVADTKSLQVVTEGGDDD
jgi:ATP-dependent protease HslVU (ClpYQ) peptidase subunit